MRTVKHWNTRKSIKRLSFAYDTLTQSLRIEQRLQPQAPLLGCVLELSNEEEIREFIQLAKCIEDAYKRSKLSDGADRGPHEGHPGS